MLIGAVTTDPFSLGDAAGLFAGLLVLAVLVACIAICAEDSPISDFLRRTQAKPAAKHAGSRERAMTTKASIAAPRAPGTGKDQPFGPK